MLGCGMVDAGMGMLAGGWTMLGCGMLDDGH